MWTGDGGGGWLCVVSGNVLLPVEREISRLFMTNQNVLPLEQQQPKTKKRLSRFSEIQCFSIKLCFLQ